MSPGQKFFSSPTVLRITKYVHKFLDHRLLKRVPKSLVFSILAFVVIFCIVYAGNIVSSFSSSSSSALAVGNSDGILSQKVQELPSSNATDADDVLLSDDLADEDAAETNLEDPDMLIPPFNVTREERLAWFRQRLPDLEMFNSNDLTEKFHGRVLEFLNNNCTVQFFMIWNSPARTFKSRDFLAIDSLFTSNPGGCLLLLSRTMDTKRGYRILKPILDLGFKVLAVTPDLPFLMKNTPAENWFEQLRSGKQDPGGYIVTNLANMIRFATLYKYGGVYLDTDLIVLKDISGLRNSIGSITSAVDTKNWLNNAAMAFDIGHPLLDMFLEEFANTYNGNRWGNNGPHLVTRVIQRVRSTPEFNYTILPPKAFYPVDWVRVKRLFTTPSTEEELKWAEQLVTELQSGDSYGVHLWNKQTDGLKIEAGSVMGRLIEQHCVICDNIYS